MVARSVMVVAHVVQRWGLLAVAFLVMWCAASAGPPAARPHMATQADTAPATQLTMPPDLTPIPGDYSVYVDPLFGYSLQYPATWTVTPGASAHESDIAITAPFTTDPTHPATILIVRATTDYQQTFVQHLLCGQDLSGAQVNGYPAVVLDTNGGDPVDGYSAVAYGRAFFAKGIAFEIWLQGSPRLPEDIAAFLQMEQPVFAHILASFQPGPGATPVAHC
jgi:hypothetical protein